MILAVTDEFLEILVQISAENRSPAEWAAIESDDMFQSAHFVGGYDADEEAFCFSYFDDDRNEFWFQFPLATVADMRAGRVTELAVRPAGS